MNTTKANQVRFESTTQFEFSHGKKPSGFGVWAFAADFGDTEVEFFTPNSMSYTDAKKWVKAAVVANVVPMP
jgi:hypothetical protein